MYDYKLLEAMNAVFEQGSFELGARRLHITQSATSQRIRQLEETIGSPVMIRSSPPHLTEVGHKLLEHYRKVKLLESELDLGAGKRLQQSVQVALNRDSLALWFIDAVTPLLQTSELVLELIAVDEKYTHERLKEGSVLACVSSRKRSLQGCKVQELGSMRYHLVSTPSFRDKWFSDGLDTQSVSSAPGVVFDSDDHSLQLFLSSQLKTSVHPVAHKVPAISEYVSFVKSGFGYGLLAASQIENEVKSGELVHLAPGQCLEVPLYWHTWQLETKLTKKLSEAVLKGALEFLR